jgi:hypothetical protein
MKRNRAVQVLTLAVLLYQEVGIRGDKAPVKEG